MAELGNHPVSFPSSDFNGPDDGAVYGPFGAAISGTITDYHIYLDNTSTTNTVRPLIYASSGSDPGALIATLAEISIPNSTGAWRDITGLSIPFTGPIYIGAWFHSSVVNYYYNGTGPGFYKAAIAAYSSSADCVTPWPAASDTPTSTQAVAVYVGYTPTGGGAPVTFGTVTKLQAVKTAAGW